MTGRGTRLDAVRRTIDALDRELLDLLSRRASAVAEVAAVKNREAEPRYYQPEREATLLRRLETRNAGPLPDAEVARLFREIVSTCRAIEQRLTVGCATVRGACAAIGHFGGAVDVVPAPDAARALDALSAARRDYVVIAFAPAGEAAPALADLPGRGLALCGEWYARDGERYVVVGREPVPPTGDDWTSLLVPAPRVAAVESWRRASRVRMRSTPVAGRASCIVDVAAHPDEPRLASLPDECGGVVLGAYPNAGPRDG